MSCKQAISTRQDKARIALTMKYWRPGDTADDCDDEDEDEDDDLVKTQRTGRDSRVNCDFDELDFTGRGELIGNTSGLDTE